MGMRTAILGLAAVVAIGAAFMAPPMGQGSVYHRMADERTIAGIPNALNVLSNIPFAIVGLMGLAAVSRARRSFADPRDTWPFVALFGAVVLTSVCSSYYHLAPDNARLVWDRLPMTIGFMGLLSAVVAERVSAPAGRVLLGPLVAAGIASVIYWYWTELQGAGDLRPYALVQFGSLLLVGLILAFYPRRDAGTTYLVAGLAIYGVAKAFELADDRIFAAGGVVSGHALKHVAAAAGVWCIVLMVRGRARRTVPDSNVELVAGSD